MRCAVAFLFLQLGTPTFLSADIIAFDAAKDFSINQNPNGQWSYGATSSLRKPESRDLCVKRRAGIGA